MPDDKDTGKMPEYLKNALDQPMDIVKTIMDRVDWLIGNADEVDAITLREQLRAMLDEFVAVDSNRVEQIILGYSLADTTQERLDRQADLNRELMLSNDELQRALLSERQNAKAWEKSLAKRMSYELDFELDEAQTVVDMLTGDLDVYLSVYTHDDVREILEMALDEIRQTRADMDADGGVAD